jgi:hypothetical protein
MWEDMFGVKAEKGNEEYSKYSNTVSADEVKFSTFATRWIIFDSSIYSDRFTCKMKGPRS